MSLERSGNAYRYGSRETRVLDAVANYRYYAPRILAFNEEYERLLAEAALSQVLDTTEPTTGRRGLIDRACHRLGSLLILLGTSRQGAPAIETTLPAASDPRSTAA